VLANRFPENLSAMLTALHVYHATSLQVAST
jgi:hypothetical protein